MTRRIIPDGDPTVPAPRTLGRRPGQACSGNDARLSDARETVQVNGTDVGKRRNINLIQGTNVTITGADDPDADKVDITINSSGGGGSGVRIEKDAVLVATAVTTLNFEEAGNSFVTVTSPVSGKVTVEVATYDTPPIEAISGVTPAANKLAYFDSGTTATTTDITAFARSILDDANAAAARATLGAAAIGGQGATTINFGAFPGSSDTSINITGETGIDSSSVVSAWLMPTDTDDHTADEHRVETISVMAGNVVPGVGFTIYAQNTSQLNEPLGKAGVDKFRSIAAPVYGYAAESSGGTGTLIYGKWTIAWKWS